jgi:2-polyprenyl-3-methyl-5-hydroxy-6-metoxy-1,4-benzoquinol methylase
MSSEEIVRRVQARFVQYFAQCQSVLDLGCGRGVFLELLRESRIMAQGVDLSKDAVAACRAKGFRIVQEDVLTFLAREESVWDGIFCSHLIEHFPYVQAVSLLRGCHKVLAPGGILVVVTPNSLDLRVMTEILWLDPSHMRPYPLPLLVEMLAEAGVSVQETGTFSGAGWRSVGRRNLLRHWLLRLLLGRYYGNHNAYAVARRAGR